MLPIIKWAGGKRKFAKQIYELLGSCSGRYYEPFLGGGAVLLSMMPKIAICSDINVELINTYNVVKNNPLELIKELKNNYIPYHNKDFYYKIRALDRDLNIYNSLTDIEKAARFMYLNKTCYNGLWRVNKKGENNVPFGRFINPKILPEEDIVLTSQYFNNNNIMFHVSDYKSIVKSAKSGDIVYFDPPYDIEKGENGFVQYTQDGFNREDQIQLKNLCDSLIMKGVIVGVSNSNTKFIRDLYENDEYHFYELHEDFISHRMIAGNINSRKKIKELFILGKINEKIITTS